MEQIIAVSITGITVLSFISIILIFNAFYILAFFKAFQDPYLFSPLDRVLKWILLSWESKIWIIDYIKDNLYEGFCGCLDCMPSIHSFIFLSIVLPYFGITDITYYLPLLPFYICILSSVVEYLNLLRENIKSNLIKNS